MGIRDLLESIRYEEKIILSDKSSKLSGVDLYNRVQVERLKLGKLNYPWSTKELVLSEIKKDIRLNKIYNYISSSL